MAPRRTPKLMRAPGRVSAPSPRASGSRSEAAASGGASMVGLTSCAVATAGRAAATVITTANDSTHISGDREFSTRPPLLRPTVFRQADVDGGRLTRPDVDVGREWLVTALPPSPPRRSGRQVHEQPMIAIGAVPWLAVDQHFGVGGLEAHR